MKKLIICGVAAVAVAASFPIASADDHRGHRGKSAHGMYNSADGHGGRHHKRRKMFRFLTMLEKHDKNGDGDVTQDEIDQSRADRLAEFDKDGDGTLTIAEYEALWLDAMRKRMVRRFQRHDSDGDGKITVEEFSERTKHAVLMRDRNGDGKLNMEDAKSPKSHRGHRRGQKGPRREHKE